jgi:hypothetical protein
MSVINSRRVVELAYPDLGRDIRLPGCNDRYRMWNRPPRFNLFERALAFGKTFQLCLSPAREAMVIGAVRLRLCFCPRLCIAYYACVCVCLLRHVLAPTAYAFIGIVRYVFVHGLRSCYAHGLRHCGDDPF